MLVANEQVEDKGDQTDDDRAPESTPWKLDVKAYTQQLADPGGEPKQECVDHQCKQAKGEHNTAAGEKLQNWADKNVYQPKHDCHDGERKPGISPLNRHEVIWEDKGGYIQCNYGDEPVEE